MSELYDRCLMCGKKLQTDKSRKLGYGESCYKKYLERINKRSLNIGVKDANKLPEKIS